MRVCVLQSAYPDNRQPDHDPGYHPEFYIPMHSFEHRWICKDHAMQDIESALEEKFDVYFNLIWGQYEDSVAGIEAVQYLEKRVPSFIGFPSRALLQSKRDFYEAARAHGKPQVPGSDLSHYPLFVKPASGCGSQGIDGSSLCFSEADLRRKISALDRALGPGRKNRPIGTTKTTLCEDEHQEVPSDILVTEYISGCDYFVIVCRVGGVIMTFCPGRWCLPGASKEARSVCKDQFLTQELKYHPGTRVAMVNREEGSQLYDALQGAALEAWQVADNGADWGHVDMRVRPSGEVVVLEVNPMPGIFTPPGKHQWDDPQVAEWFPGGHRSLLNCAIARHRLHLQGGEIGPLRESQVSVTYDAFSKDYDKGAMKVTNTVSIIEQCVADFAFPGKVLDLGCGTGAFGRALAQKSSSGRDITITGIEISPGMARYARSSGAYASIMEGSMQQKVGLTGLVDHVVCFYALQFLDIVDLDFILTFAFLTTATSVTFSIDEVPDDYNKALRQSGQEHMVQNNHLKAVEEFGMPQGWELAFKKRFFAWKSWHTGHDVYTTVFRFERRKTASLVAFV